MKGKRAIVIGAGAFGTSMGAVLSSSFEEVIFKVRSQDTYDALKSGENSIYLPGLKLPSNIKAALSWDEVKKISSNFENVELIVSGLPTSAIKPFLANNKMILAEFLNREIPIVSLSKGIDPDTLELPDDQFFDVFPDDKDMFTFLSGPSFAKEIIEKQITLVSLAGRKKKVLEKVSSQINNEYFKVFNNYDIKGVLLGGALKNIIAIAGGVAEGLGFNHNTRAALITRAIAEMLRFGKIFNARPETFYGLSGMGDLILTTTGDLSRNKIFGMELAKGRKAKEIIESQRSVVEGYKTAKAAHLLSKEYDIRATIFNGVYKVLYEDMDPQQALKLLMSQPAKFE